MITTLARGKIEICNEQGKAASSVSFTFNPSSYTIQTSPKFGETKTLGKDAPKKSFVGGSGRTLTTTLHFDSYSDSSLVPSAQLLSVTALSVGLENKLKPVTDKINKLEKAAHVDGKGHEPPLVIFSWGNLHFKGHITSFSAEYTLFSMEGKPIRANVNLTIAEYIDPSMDSKKSPFESPDRTKSRVIVEGMSLWGIAYEEYGDCEKWRVIARENHIMDPTKLEPGMVLLIPAITT